MRRFLSSLTRATRPDSGTFKVFRSFSNPQNASSRCSLVFGHTQSQLTALVIHDVVGSNAVVEQTRDGRLPNADMILFFLSPHYFAVNQRTNFILTYKVALSCEHSRQCSAVNCWQRSASSGVCSNSCSSMESRRQTISDCEALRSSTAAGIS